MGAKTVLAGRCREAAREIEETRRRIGERTEQLQGRLTPRALLRPVTSRLQGTLGEGGEKILDSFRDNPIPLTLTGLGLGWLILKDLRGKPAGNGAEAAAAVPGKVRHGLEKASDWFSTTLEENPLVLTVAVLALGALAGLSVPASRKEEESLAKADEVASVLEKGEAPAEAAPVETGRLDMPASEEDPE